MCFVGISRFPAVCFLRPSVLKQTPGAQLRPVIRELLLGGSWGGKYNRKIPARAQKKIDRLGTAPLLLLLFSSLFVGRLDLKLVKINKSPSLITRRLQSQSRGAS